MVANSSVGSWAEDPVAERLLTSAAPARLAYTWTDGTPRVVPIGFHWDGTAFVLGTPVRAPELKVLADRPAVALTVDTTDFPYLALPVRGQAEVCQHPRLRDATAERPFSLAPARADPGRTNHGHRSAGHITAVNTPRGRTVPRARYNRGKRRPGSSPVSYMRAVGPMPTINGSGWPTTSWSLSV